MLLHHWLSLCKFCIDIIFQNSEVPKSNPQLIQGIPYTKAGSVSTVQGAATSGMRYERDLTKLSAVKVCLVLYYRRICLVH